MPPIILSDRPERCCDRLTRQFNQGTAVGGSFFTARAFSTLSFETIPFTSVLKNTTAYFDGTYLANPRKPMTRSPWTAIFFCRSGFPESPMIPCRTNFCCAQACRSSCGLPKAFLPASVFDGRELRPPIYSEAMMGGACR